MGSKQDAEDFTLDGTYVITNPNTFLITCPNSS